MTNAIFSIAYVFSLLFSLATGSYQYAENASSAPDIDRSYEAVVESGTLVIGCDDSFAPISYLDESGNYSGFDIDLARAAAAKMGLELSVKSINWDDKIHELNSKAIDAIWSGMTITPERNKVVCFTEPYYTDTYVFVVKSDSTIKGKTQLQDKVIGYQNGSASEYIVTEFSSAQSFSGNDIPGVIAALDKGVVDAVLMNSSMLPTRNSISTDYRIIPGDFPNDSEDWGVAFRLEDSELRDAVQKALNEMKADGTYASIYKKWFGIDPFFQNTTP